MTATTDSVQRLYIAYFNRPADPIGLQYWVNQIGAGQSVESVANNFARQTEYSSNYTGLTSSQIVNTIYQNLFGHDADFNGLIYWATQLEGGTQTIGKIALSISLGAIGADKTAIDSKIAAATAFTGALDQTTEITNYTGTAAFALAKQFLAGITDAASLQAAIATTALNDTVAQVTGAGGPPGQTYTLTTGVDTLTGTAGNDVFNAVIDTTPTPIASTLTSLDTLNGGGGTDTLNLNVISNVSTFPAVSATSIETLNLRAAGNFTASVSSITGLATANVTQVGGNLDLTAGSGTAINISGVSGTVDTDGGKSVKVSSSANQDITIKNTGAVSVTTTAQTSGNDIAVSSATGTVVVNASGPAFAGNSGKIKLGKIDVTGGTTISVTQHATSDASAAATDAKATDSITQGAVTIVAGTTTTSVSVVQDDQADGVTAVAARAAVKATSSVTFVALASGESVTVDNLTFTASKALTAAEVAAAFAGLSATAENQGQGFSVNGFYSGQATGNFSSGAVTGSTVVFTEKTGGSGSTLQNVASHNVGSTGNATAGAVSAVPGSVSGVSSIDAVGGAFDVANGAVTIDDNTTKASITTVTVNGYDGGATLGGTHALDALTTLTLANSGGGAASVKTSVTSLGLTLNDVNDNNGGSSDVTITDANLKTLNITTDTASSYVHLSAGATDLNVSGTKLLNLTGSTLSSLDKVTVTGSAGLTFASTTATSVNTSATTGTVTATIDSSAATYTGGAGVDNVTFSNTTAATKAVSLGAGNDRLTVASGTTLTVPTSTIDGGDGTDTLVFAADGAASATANYAAKFVNFERLSLGVVATQATTTVDLSLLNNYNYVISAGSAGRTLPTTSVTAGTAGTAGAPESTTFTFGAGLEAGESFTIDGLTVTSSGSNSAAAVAAVFRSHTSAGTLTVSGSYATPSDWTGTPLVSGATDTLVLTNTANGDVTNFTASSSTGNGTLVLNKFANAGTLELTGAAGTTTVNLTDATGTSDSLNLITKVSTAALNFGTVNAAGVESINLTVTDTAPTNPSTGAASIQTATLAISDAALKTLTVTGNGNLTLTSTGNNALTSLDASALTGRLTASTNGAVAETIKGSLTAANTLTAASTPAALADTLIGGAAADSLTANGGLTTLTGGGGADTFRIVTGSLNVNSYATITDATVGDIIFLNGASTFAAAKIALGATAVFQDYANAAVAGSTAGAVSWFNYGGDTYIVQDNNAGASFVNGLSTSADYIVKLTGVIDLSHASFSSSARTIELGA